MSPDNNAVKVRADAVRAASEEGVVRYVLGVSLSLAITALSFVWISAAVAMP